MGCAGSCSPSLRTAARESFANASHIVTASSRWVRTSRCAWFAQTAQAQQVYRFRLTVSPKPAPIAVRICSSNQKVGKSRCPAASRWKGAELVARGLFRLATEVDGTEVVELGLARLIGTAAARVIGEPRPVPAEDQVHRDGDGTEHAGDH